MNEELRNFVYNNIINAGSICNTEYEIIHHYTSPDGLLSILRKNAAKLWFTRYDSLNDRSERKDFLNFLEEYCQYEVKKGEISSEFFDEIKKLGCSDYSLITYQDDSQNCDDSYNLVLSSKYVPCDTYLCCFSEHPDLLPLWNYYSKNQHYQGYSIGFQSYAVEGIHGLGDGYSIEVKRVIYQNSEKVKLLNSILLPLDKLYLSGSAETKQDVLEAVKMMIGQFQFVFKNASFEHEKEIRAILCMPQKPISCDVPFEVKYRNSNGYIVPYIEYPIPTEGVSEITIAPLLQADISKKNLSEMLEHRGYSHVNVRTSEIPIRF